MKNTSLKKIGIFGSSFNPVHLGHINLLIQTQEVFQFNALKVIPVYQNPKSPPILKPSPKLRLDIVKKIFQTYSFMEVDSQEIEREGKSYTVDTIENLFKKGSELFLIMGMDQWMHFHQWKNYENIFKKANLIVCSRASWPGFKVPLLLKNFVAKKKSENQNLQSFELITKKNIYFLKLNDMDISSSQIRARNSKNLPIHHLVPVQVDKWIQKFKLYQEEDVGIEDSIEHIQFCVDHLKLKKALQIKVFDLRQFPHLPFDFTLVASGLNIRHTKVLAQDLQRQIKKQFAVKTDHTEGKETGEWIVLDYGLWVVHLFYNYTRESYRIEQLWQKAPVLTL